MASFFCLVRPERFELPTNWFEASYSIQLSYGRMERGLYRDVTQWSRLSSHRDWLSYWLSQYESPAGSALRCLRSFAPFKLQTNGSKPITLSS